MFVFSTDRRHLKIVQKWLRLVTLHTSGFRKKYPQTDCSRLHMEFPTILNYRLKLETVELPIISIAIFRIMRTSLLRDRCWNVQTWALEEDEDFDF